MDRIHKESSCDIRQMLAYALRLLRQTEGLTQIEAARQAGISPSLLADAESAIWADEFRVNELGAICRAYGVDALELMGWTEKNLAGMIEKM